MKLIIDTEAITKSKNVMLKKLLNSYYANGERKLSSGRDISAVGKIRVHELQ